MKKVSFRLLGLTFASIGLLFLTGAFTPNNAAVHINEGSCGMFDGDGGIVVTDNVKVVITNSANGNTMLRCKADVANSTGSAVVYSDFVCGTPGGFTTSSHETVSASGKATLTCHVNNSGN